MEKPRTHPAAATIMLTNKPPLWLEELLPLSISSNCDSNNKTGSRYPRIFLDKLRGSRRMIVIRKSKLQRLSVQ